MDKILNQIKEILQNTAPICVDNIYLYFEDIEDLVSVTFYVQIGKNIKSYFEIKVEYKDYIEYVNQSVSQLLELVRKLYACNKGTWTWGKIQLNLKDNTGMVELFDNKWDYYEYLSENRYVWEYINFGKIYPKDCYSENTYKKIMLGDKIGLLYNPVFRKSLS